MSKGKRTRRTKKESERLRRKVAALALRGLRPTEIGARLGISRELARYHLERARETWAEDLAAVESRTLLQEALLQAREDRAIALDRHDAAKAEAERRRYLQCAHTATQTTIRLLLEAPQVVGPRLRPTLLDQLKQLRPPGA